MITPIYHTVKESYDYYPFYEKYKGMENRKMYTDFVFEEHDFLPEPNIPKRFRKLYDCE